MSKSQKQTTFDAATKVGFWAALVAFLADIAYDTVQALQTVNIPQHPWSDALVYATSLCIATPFLVSMAALHYKTEPRRQMWSLIGLVFSIMYTTYVTLNYVVQLATVIPSSLQGTLSQVGVLNQTPHSLFWDVDALGYISLGFATLFAAQAFAKNGFQNWTRKFFLANALVTPLITIVYFYPVYSSTLLFVGFPWGITSAGSMLLLAIQFRRH